jgi:putative hydrolase of the HAD superfamily
MAPVVTFDAGQTLVDLDLDFLARRLDERGLPVAVGRLAEAAPAAWQRYDARVGHETVHPWHDLMTDLLRGAGLHDVGPVVDWLWSEQARANLWRKPIPGMVELARELAGRGVAVGVLSNSEGHLAELFVEIGIAGTFAAIIDSGRLGIEKPDRRIFEHAHAALGAGEPRVHIGDSWPADIEGALGAGWRAIWFGARARAVEVVGVSSAWEPAEVRQALARFGV